MARRWASGAAALAALWAGTAAAFDPATCPNVVRDPTVPADAMPAAVTLAAQPGLFSDDIECHIGPLQDGSIGLGVVEYLPNGDGWVTVSYLRDGVVMELLEPDGRVGPRVAQCVLGAPGVQCLADLFIDDSLVLTFGMGDTPDDTQMSLTTDLDRLLPDVDLSRIPPADRIVALRLSTVETPFRLLPMEGHPTVHALFDGASLLAFWIALAELPHGTAPGLGLRVTLPESDSRSTIHSFEQAADRLQFVVQAARHIGSAMNRQRLGP